MMTVFTFSLFSFCVVLSVDIKTVLAMATTRVVVTTPLSNVKEGDMLSVHCQVWNLADDHKITMSRKTEETSKTVVITWDQVVQPYIDERVFLATRRLDDGSVVYFMSIIDVVKEDSGLYYCKVVSTDPFEEIRTDSIRVAINYYPNNMFPVCSPSEPVILTMGTPVVVNCSSESGYPSVDLQWYRSRDEAIFGARQYNSSGLVISELEIIPSWIYNDIVLVCKVTSSAFPERTESCHIGPFHINTKGSGDKGILRLPNLRTPSGKFDTIQTTPDTAVTVAIYPDGSGHCRDLCPSTLTSPVMYWVVATIFIGLLAFIFLLITVMLSVKICRSPPERNRQHMRNTHKRAVEELYEKLECRRDDQTVYMSLQRPRKPDNLVVLRDTDFEGNYTGTPTVPTMQ